MTKNNGSFNDIDPSFFFTCDGQSGPSTKITGMIKFASSSLAGLFHIPFTTTRSPGADPETATSGE